MGIFRFEVEPFRRESVAPVAGDGDIQGAVEPRAADERNNNGGAVMRKLLAFEAKPSWLKIPGLLAAAFKH